jgi:manganese transport protein
MGKSLEEVNQSIATEGKKTGFRKILAFLGPAYLISVGYMDPGNWLEVVSLVIRCFGFY